jgi:hypothetical protein
VVNVRVYVTSMIHYLSCKIPRKILLCIKTEKRAIGSSIFTSPSLGNQLRSGEKSPALRKFSLSGGFCCCLLLR